MLTPASFSCRLRASPFQERPTLRPRRPSVRLHPCSILPDAVPTAPTSEATKVCFVSASSPETRLPRFVTFPRLLSVRELSKSAQLERRRRRPSDCASPIARRRPRVDVFPHVDALSPRDARDPPCALSSARLRRRHPTVTKCPERATPPRLVVGVDSTHHRALPRTLPPLLGIVRKTIFHAARTRVRRKTCAPRCRTRRTATATPRRRRVGTRRKLSLIHI